MSSCAKSSLPRNSECFAKETSLELLALGRQASLGRLEAQVDAFSPAPFSARSYLALRAR